MPDHEGIRITINGREWVVPSLTRGEKRRLQAQGAFERKSAPEFLTLEDNNLLVAKTALLHNYPELTDADFDELTPVQIGELAQAVVYATCGFKEMPDPGASSRQAETTGATTSKT